MSNEAAAAERAIHALLKDWTRRVDHGPPEEVATLFVEDGVYELPEGREVGRAQIDAGVKARFAMRRTVRHVMTNVAVFVEGPDTGSGQGIVTVYRHDGEGMGDTIPSSVFDFEDRYRRSEDGRWRFVERRMLRIFGRPKA